MKKILAIGIVALAGVFGLFRWHVNGASVTAWPSYVPSSSSQITIHGTPVCVFSLNGNIFAKVGPCPEASGAPEDRDGPPEGKSPDDGKPGIGLPPGHPPVGDGMLPDGPRRVLI